MLKQNDLSQPDFGCGFGDWSCVAMESCSRFFVSSIQAMGDFIADMLANAFKVSRPTEDSWDVADAGFWFWVSVLGLVVAVVAIVQLIPAMLLKDGRRALQIGLGAAAAVPASSFSVWATRQLSDYGDTVTGHITSSIQGVGMGQALLHVFGWTDTDGVTTILADSPLASVPLAASNPVGQYLLLFLITGVMALASLFLYVGMSMRSFSLIVLAATAPLGLMMIGQPKLAAWAHRWANLTVGVILAQPLSAFVLFLAVALLGRSEDLGLLFVAAGAVFAAAFAPMWAVGLVSFAGRETASALAARPRIRENVNRGTTVIRILSLGNAGR